MNSTVTSGGAAGVMSLLRGQSYLADTGLATALGLALDLGVPLLLEGEPGVGKTEVARALADASGKELVRLQCYEGIEASSALYDWDYARQLIYIKACSERSATEEQGIFSERFLLERPLLAALRKGGRAVLLIDEIDRADDAFEAFLLELLSDFQITIPELGTIKAEQPPTVILTSNRTRELHDALRRRCLFHWIGYPSRTREAEIVAAKVPGLPEDLVYEVTAMVERIRELDLYKSPGVSETLMWARALATLGVIRLGRESVEATLGAVLKEHDDVVHVVSMLDELMAVP